MGSGLLATTLALAQAPRSEITGRSADTLSGHINAKDVTCRAVMAVYLAQIERINPQVNAIVALPDAEGLLAQATERDDQLARWHGVVNDVFGKYDVAIAPTAQVFPFDVTTPYPTVVGGRETESYHQWMGVVLPWSLAGIPVMNLPVGLNADGLPMGVQLIGKRQSELDVLQMAFAYEAATGYVETFPAPIR